MRRRRWKGSGIGRLTRVGIVMTCVAAIGACSSSDETTTTTAVRREGSVAESVGTEWPVYGHDYANTRLNASEKEIDRTTVARLTEDWSKDGLIGVSGTPVVSGGVAYFGDWAGKVWAVKADTGAEMWSVPVGGMVVGAPAVDGDAVYASSGRTLYRLDRATGAVRWKVETNEHPLSQINASPVVVDGLVLQGVASFEVVMAKAEYTFRGSIGAYDAATGKERWRFYTTPDDPSAGAGVGIWSTPAVDRERGLLYVGSGNTYAQPTAPLADSILAIDYKTGKLKWSTQFTNPDVFSAGNPGGKDADVGASPNLWTSNGRDLVGAGDKAGVYHALDRDTGKVAWETKLTAGSFFGGEIGSAAFVDGKLVAVSNLGDAATNAPTNKAKVFALNPASGALVWESEEFAGLMFGPVAAVKGVAFVGTNTGSLAALDTRSGKKLWSHQAPDKTGCGPSIVNGRVLWGYGFTLFGGAGKGGVISFKVGSEGS